MRNEKQRPPTPWSDQERDRLRALIAAGSGTREAAVALGREFGSVQSMTHKLGLRTWDSVVPRTRDAIREHAGLGWSSSRIAKRVGVSTQAVDAWTGRTAS